MKTCQRCGEEKPLPGRRRTCDDCKIELRRERVRRYQKGASRDKWLTAKKRYYDSNRERLREEHKAYYWANREAKLAKARVYRLTYPEKKRASRNPDMFYEYVRRRRARQASVETDGHTRAEIFERDGGKCRSCGEVLTLKNFTIDHIVPIALGGPDVRANVQVLCKPCNSKKGVRLEGQIGLPV